MKSKLFLFVFLFQALISVGQNVEKAKTLVDEGVAYHDKGDYAGAIKRYDEALFLDKDNLIALTEKGMSLMALNKFEEVVVVSKRAIAEHPNEEGLKLVYVQYANALDGLKKTDESIEMYNEGIKNFPTYYQLHFNKGVTLASVRKFDAAITSLQKALLLNPDHAGSHNALARICQVQGKRIPSLLAYCRFLTIEPQSARAKENVSNILEIVNGNVERKDEKTININIPSKSLEEKKSTEDNFTSQDLLLSLDAALDFDEKNKNKTNTEQFIRKFETLCASLGESKKDNKGFFWLYYAPYFKEMKERKFIKTFGYIVFASSDDKDVEDWLKANKSEIDKFFEWSNSFKWTNK